jgi:ABC-type dipeptide/oligopeptide/nickel transport system permease component
MLRFLSRRILQSIVTLFLLFVAVFILARATGDPVGLLVPPEGGAETVALVRTRLGLDQPYYVQFILFVKNTLMGDLGISFRTQRPVLDLILERLPYTVVLALAAMIIGTLLAVPMAMVASLRRGKPIDTAIQVIGALGIATPQFWLGLVLIQVFAGGFRLLPVGGAGTWKHFILPAVTLGVFQAANMLRVLRSSLLEVLSSDFVTLARMKGLQEYRVIGSHVMRNAILPVLTFAGILLATLMTGTIVVETVFAWPGFGRLAYDATVYRDFPLIQGVVIVAGLIVVGMSLAVDILYALLDPRIRLS